MQRQCQSKPILPIPNQPVAINLLLLMIVLLWVLLKALLVNRIQDCHQQQWVLATMFSVTMLALLGTPWKEANSWYCPGGATELFGGD